jgi:uracil-DNA glycosylase
VLDIIQPKIIVTLGGVGLQAMNLLLQTKFQLKHDAAKWQKLKAPLKLLPLYHPSPRVTNWQRPLQQQKIDFNKITRALKKHRNSL